MLIVAKVQEFLPGELGAVIGPAAGALLTGYGFRQIAYAGAAVFVLAMIVLFFTLPAAPKYTAMT